MYSVEIDVIGIGHNLSTLSHRTYKVVIDAHVNVWTTYAPITDSHRYKVVIDAPVNVWRQHAPVTVTHTDTKWL